MTRRKLAKALGIVAGMALACALGYAVGSRNTSGPAPSTDMPGKAVVQRNQPTLGPTVANETGSGPDQLSEYFGFPEETDEATPPEFLDRLVEAGARKAVGDFVAVWKDPTVKGYTWDVQKEQARLTARLRFLKVQDYHARRIATELKRRVEDASLSEPLRSTLYELLVLFRPRAEMRYFRALAQTSKDSWLRSAAVSYLARNRDPDAFAIAMKNIMEGKDLADQQRSLASIAAYCGEEAELEVPSKHWGALASEAATEEELQLLIEDVRTWWRAHRPEYEK